MDTLPRATATLAPLASPCPGLICRAPSGQRKTCGSSRETESSRRWLARIGFPDAGREKKCLPPPRPRGRMTLRRLADGRPAAHRPQTTAAHEQNDAPEAGGDGARNGKISGPRPGDRNRSWANPSTAENSVGRSFPPRRRWLRSDLSATASPSPGSFGVPAARGWTETFRFRWKTSVGRSTCPGRRSASIGSSGIGIPGIGKNVRLLARNRVVTAMAGPDRIPGRGTRKKCLPPPRPRGRMTLRRLADGRPAAHDRRRPQPTNKTMQPSRVYVRRHGCVFLSRPVDRGRSWANPATAENSVGRSFPPRRRWLRSDLSATASPSPGSFGVPAARGWTETSRFRWKTSVGRSTRPGRRSASIGSSGIGIPGIGKNVRLLARNRVVTAMAGPDRIPGRWTRKKMLATAAAAR
jgi:hypothetical protein